MRYLVIRTENLSKNFGVVQALQNLTLEVEPGEVYGVLGPQGAGKTTFLNLLMNVIRPSSGSALVMGLDSVQHAQQIRQKVGHLPQSFPLPGNLSGETVVNRTVNLRGPIDQPYLKELTALFGLDLSRRISTLNPAEKQALGIVLAFLRQPDLVLLDSPSNNLSPERQTQLYRLIAEKRAAGGTVVIASQSLLEMERICDRVAVLNCGQLLAVERGVSLRARALRKIELRFAEPVQAEAFNGLANIRDLTLDENKLRCTVQGEPDALFKTASRFRLLDVISQQPSLDEVYQNYYGVFTRSN